MPKSASYITLSPFAIPVIRTYGGVTHQPIVGPSAAGDARGSGPRAAGASASGAGAKDAL